MPPTMKGSIIMSIMKEINTKKDIEHYLGITDNEDRAYKNKCIAEFKQFQKKYTDNDKVETCLIGDLGIYIPYSEIIEQGELVAVFIE